MESLAPKHACGYCRNPFTGGREDCPRNLSNPERLGASRRTLRLAPPTPANLAHDDPDDGDLAHDDPAGLDTPGTPPDPRPSRRPAPLTFLSAVTTSPGGAFRE